MELLEREAELTHAEELIVATLGGAGQALAFEAPAGGGKTLLLQAIKSRAHERGLEVLFARAAELERGFAFGVARQLFEPVLGMASAGQRRELLSGAAKLAATALEPAAAPPGGSRDTPFAVMHGLYWLTVNLSARRPLLLAVDDLHWCDDSSLRWLAYLVARLEGMPVLVAATVRPPEPELVSELLGAPGVLRRQLGALTESAVRAVVRSRYADDADDSFCQACHAATRGNPLYVVELLKALESERVPATAEHSPRVERLAPAGVSRLVELRLARLGSDALGAARAASVLGGSAELRHVAALATLTEDAAARALDDLRRADVLTHERPPEFVHPIVREAVYQSMAPGERALLHGHAARVLRETHAPAADVAPHLLQSDPMGEQWIVDALREAAVSVRERGAPDLAATHLERALREPPADELRGPVLTELGAAELDAGDLHPGERSSAIAHLREALPLASDPIARARTAAQLGDALWGSWELDAALEVLDGAIDELDGRDRALDMLLRVHAAGVCFFAALPPSAAGERLAPIRGVTGGDAAEQLVLGARAYESAWNARSADEVAALAERALTGTADAPTGAASPMSLNFAPVALVFADRLDSAAEVFERAIGDAQEQGAVRTLAIAYCWRSHIACLRGSVSAAEADARTALELSAVRGLQTQVPLAHAFLIDALLEAGDVDGAASALSSSGLGEQAPPYAGWTWLLVRRGRLRLAQGRPAEALVDLRAAAERQERFGPRNPSVVSWRRYAAPAHAALGQVDMAVRLGGEEVEEAEAFGAVTAIGTAYALRGMNQDGKAGIADLERAVEILDSAPGRLELIRALTELGAALRRAGRRVQAREPLRWALDLAQQAGAKALATRAHRELLGTGARPRRLRVTGLDALTAAERRVAELGAQGLANREIAETLFVTVRTVEVHLSNAYRKLGIQSRSALPQLFRSSSRQPAAAGDEPNEL